MRSMIRRRAWCSLPPRAKAPYIFHEDSLDKLTPVQEIKTQKGGKTPGAIRRPTICFRPPRTLSNRRETAKPSVIKFPAQPTTRFAIVRQRGTSRQTPTMGVGMLESIRASTGGCLPYEEDSA